MRVGVIGLGSMGFGMATNLVRAGHETYGFDVNPDAMSRFEAVGGRIEDFADIGSSLQALVVVVLNMQQLEAALFDKGGAVEHLAPGTVIVACPTISPAFARDMEARCTAAGMLYLDAPISGGAGKAASGELSVMASGAPDAFAAAKPVLDACSATVFALGDAAGAGSAMKAVNQMLAGVHLAAMSEAIVFGMTQGISPETFQEVIPQCAGTSWMLENRTPHIVDGDYTPRSAIDIWPKDLGIVLDIARASRFSAPVTAAALQQFLAASGMGLGREDDAALAKLYGRNCGVSVPGDDS